MARFNIKSGIGQGLPIASISIKVVLGSLIKRDSKLSKVLNSNKKHQMTKELMLVKKQSKCKKKIPDKMQYL